MTKSLTKKEIIRLKAATIGYGKMKTFVQKTTVSRKSVYKALSGEAVNESVADAILNTLNYLL